MCLCLTLCPLLVNPTLYKLLSVPLLTKGRFGNLAIDQLEIDFKSNWAKKHLSALQTSYSRSMYYRTHSSFFEYFYQNDWEQLAPMLNISTNYLLESLGIKTKQLRSSEFSPQSKKADLILELCIKAGATTYLSGPLGRNYLDHNAFTKAGIELIYNDYVHPEYSQCFKGFEPYMSVVDLLFNHGPQSLEIIAS